MSELPETIWTCNHVGEYGQYFPEAVEAEGEYGGTAVSYRRADVPPTLSAAMELPEVKELMEAMERAIEAIDAAYDGPDDNGAYTVRERAALAAIKEQKT